MIGAETLTARISVSSDDLRFDEVRVTGPDCSSSTYSGVVVPRALINSSPGSRFYEQSSEREKIKYL